MRLQALFFILISILLSSCYAFKAYKYRNFNLEDLDKLDAVHLPPSASPFQFAYDTSNSRLRNYLDSNLANSLTYAFLVVRNDTILYERYFGDVSESTPLPSFSVAKSFVSSLIGIALEEGNIKSLDEPITNYIPQLRKNDSRFDKVTIQHVLDMRSGVKSKEEYANPFSDVIRMGFASNINKLVSKLEMEKLPGEYEYRSVNTQLLALIIEKATGKKLQDYAIEKLWKPLGMEYVATWNTDKKQTVRAFCCINAAARDYAKFGRLYLNNGEWQGKQVIPESWVKRSVHPDTMWKYGNYKNQWWAGNERIYLKDSLDAVAFASRVNSQVRTVILDGQVTYSVLYPSGAYHAQGILGQFVYVNPAKKLVIVRLGQNWRHPVYYAQRFIYNLGKAL